MAHARTPPELLKSVPYMEHYRSIMRQYNIQNSKRLWGRPYTLWQCALAARYLEGDTVECGVGHGKSSHLICHAMSNQLRQHHVFDNFEGLSEIRPEDFTNHRQWKAGDCAYSEAKVRKNLSEHTNIIFWKGWIPDRFAEVESIQFAFVHLDVDLYQPTNDSIRFFFPRLVPGGMLVCDDYASLRCPGARKAINEYADTAGAHPIHLPVGSCLLVKGP